MYPFIEAAAPRSIVIRYTGPPIATHVSIFFPLVYLEMSLLPSISLYHCRFLFVLLYGEDVVRFSLPNSVFLPCDHGLEF